MSYSKSLWLVLLLSTYFSEPIHATVTTIAVSGDAATGVAGGLFDTFEAGVINNSGTIAFPAQLQTGVGGVVSGDANGIWSFDQGSISLLARQGSGNVPGVAGASYDLFRDLSVSNAGDVFVRGSLETGSGGVDASNREGIWRFSGSDSLVVRTGDSAAPGVTNGVFDFLPNSLHVSDIGQIAVDASLATTGGVTSDDDGGIWTYDALGGTLLARENTTVAADLSSIFNNFVGPTINDDQQIAFRASLVQGGGINSTNFIGIWKYSPLGGNVIARQGAGAVPGVASTDFTELSDPVINGIDQLAFYSELTHAGSISSTNDKGIWLYTGTTGERRHW